MHSLPRILCAGIALAASLSTTAWAEVKLTRPFTSHMVLQREMPVPIWGTASPGEKVEVKFRGQTKTITADDKGQWRVKLDPLKAGGPDVLTAGAAKLDDVLVGEVWVGSGQSNMAMPVTSYTKDDKVLEEKSKAAYPKLRLIKQGQGDAWQEATPANNASFSALLFSFGQPLQQALDVPVGLMLGAVGGTPSGFWLSDSMYRRDVACAEKVKAFAPTYKYEELLAKAKVEEAKYAEEVKAWKVAVEEARKAGKPEPRSPRRPTGVGQAGEANSGQIGQLFEAFIRPYVGFAIRGVLWDQGESRTNIAGVDQYTLMGALIKGWREDWGQGEFPFLFNQKPSGGGCAWDYENPITKGADKYLPQPADVPPPVGQEYTHAEFLRIASYPKTYMVGSTDLGAGTHPIIKSGYGARGAQVALGAVYGRKNEIIGPLYASSDFKGGKATLKFTHPGQGLALRHADNLQGFAVAGADKKFVWADAKIVGDTVEVSSPSVPQPASVRYAWSSRFPWANLFNKDGLPAQPFRTDEW